MIPSHIIDYWHRSGASPEWINERISTYSKAIKSRNMRGPIERIRAKYNFCIHVKNGAEYVARGMCSKCYRKDKRKNRE